VGGKQQQQQQAAGSKASTTTLRIAKYKIENPKAALPYQLTPMHWAADFRIRRRPIAASEDA
jgi:hypothetical protein